MNLRREPKPLAVPEAVLQDVARIQTLWRQCRAQFGAQGPFLFGEFSNADAMFAPVVTRLHTYQLPVDDDTRAYMQMILAHPAFLEWRDAGVQEKWVIAADEVK
jgi:glutathione S-transferase